MSNIRLIDLSGRTVIQVYEGFSAIEGDEPPWNVSYRLREYLSGRYAATVSKFETFGSEDAARERAIELLDSHPSEIELVPFDDWRPAQIKVHNNINRSHAGGRS